MSGLVEIKPGDSVVVRGIWRAQVRVVNSVATTMYTYLDERWDGKPRRAARRDILFAGSPEAAKLLAEQLTSSQARADDAAKSIRDQQRERDKKLITAANGEKAATP